MFKKIKKFFTQIRYIEFGIEDYEEDLQECCDLALFMNLKMKLKKEEQKIMIQR